MERGANARAIQRRRPGQRQFDRMLRWIAVALVTALTKPRGFAPMLGFRRHRRRFRSARVAPAGALVMAAMGGASLVALLDRRKAKRRGGPLTVQRSITVARSAQELHEMLRSPETLSRIMGRFAEIKPLGDSRMHWTVRTVGGRRLEWDQRIVEDRFGEALSWESAPGAAVHNAVSVLFRPAPKDWGTEVTLRLRLELEDHLLGALGRHLGPVPGGLATKALHRFKSLAETGEIPTLMQQPAARNGGRDV